MTTVGIIIALLFIAQRYFLSLETTRGHKYKLVIEDASGRYHYQCTHCTKTSLSDVDDKGTCPEPVTTRTHDSNY